MFLLATSSMPLALLPFSKLWLSARIKKLLSGLVSHPHEHPCSLHPSTTAQRTPPLSPIVLWSHKFSSEIDTNGASGNFRPDDAAEAQTHHACPLVHCPRVPTLGAPICSHPPPARHPRSILRLAASWYKHTHTHIYYTYPHTLPT